MAQLAYANQDTLSPLVRTMCGLNMHDCVPKHLLPFSFFANLENAVGGMPWQGTAAYLKDGTQYSQYMFQAYGLVDHHRPAQYSHCVLLVEKMNAWYG